MQVANVLKGLQKALKKHAPEILTGIGIVGMVAAAVTAVRATPKALQLINEQEKEVERPLTPSETVKTAWKCYIPAAVTGTLSIACLVGASAVNMKRNAALVAACTISETALKDYTAKTLDIVGPQKEQIIRDAVAKEKLEKDPVANKEVIITGGGEMMCYDVLSGRYFKSDIEQIRKAVNDINRRMRDEMYISLNDFYYEIGLEGIELGEYLGWNIEKGYLDLDFGSHLAKNGNPCLVISYKTPPQYGFDILSMP